LSDNHYYIAIRMAEPSEQESFLRYERSHPEIELLQLKQVTALHYFPDMQVLAADFPEKVLLACRALKPFLIISLLRFCKVPDNSFK
jgi:hypothetical protein